MPFIKLWVSLVMITTASPLLGKQVIVNIKEEKVLRPIYIPPNYPKIVVLPGDLASCLNQSKFIGSIPADAIKVGEGETWIREIALFLNAGVIDSPELAQFAVKKELGIPCKFEVAKGKYVWKTILIKADISNRYKNEETYILQPPNYDFISKQLERRIKNYKLVRIEKGEVKIDFKNPDLEQKEDKLIKNYRLLKIKPPKDPSK